MKTFDKIIDECAKAQMVKWDINSFKETHPSLYKVIINAMQQVKNCNTPAVSNQRELLLDFLNWFDQPIRLITHDELIDEYEKDKSSNSC